MRKIAAFARVTSLCLFLCSTLAWSATVTSDADSGPNTLRDALANATSGDTITFALPAASTITLANTLTVDKNLIIDGAGASGLTISGNHTVPVLQISGATVTISNLTIADGTTGIINLGTLTVLKCTILHNTNIGIANSGTLTVANSTLSGNTAITLGGGIKISSGSATITNNTFVNNNAQYGGAIEANSNSVSTLTNNLFLGNFVSEFGGAVYDLNGKINADRNLYWNNSDTSGTNCYQCASDANAVTADPLLGSLANNGGPTQTYLPGVGSEAVDVGDDARCAASPVGNVDQRGLVRPVGTHCDIGAVESNEQIFANAFEPLIAYSASFETCPDGWTLTGDWQCGIPDNAENQFGPAAAFEGAQCIGTQIAGNYHDNQTWDGTTATSPAINLHGRKHPMLTFRMWMDSEGATYDGGDLMISIDDGATYSVVTSVTPAYPLTIDGKPAWGGHQSSLGWQAVQADLSAYSGNVVLLRFAFRSDNSGVFPGFYVDSVSVQ
jgi:Periplasmic copper-binding protein (NosD)